MIIAEISNPGKEIAAWQGHCSRPRKSPAQQAGWSGAIVDKALATYNGRFGAMNNIHRGDSQK
jgi:hypothetical protein